MNKKEEELARIAEEIAQCQKCPLYKTATKPVPGQGSAEARVIFIGEAPGYYEDQSGVPFCGRAGKLLDKMLVLAGLKREDVFIGNILKHRPPGNRDPKPEEITACHGFLNRQIAVIEPEIIVTLGRFAMNKFLPEAKISQAHGQFRFVDYNDKEYILFPVYHPAAALRRTSLKETEEEDFKKLKEFLFKLSQANSPVKEELVKRDDKEKQMSLL